MPNTEGNLIKLAGALLTNMALNMYGKKACALCYTAERRNRTGKTETEGPNILQGVQNIYKTLQGKMCRGGDCIPTQSSFAT